MQSSIPKIFFLAEWCLKSDIQSNSNRTFHCVYQFGFLCLHKKS